MSDDPAANSTNVIVKSTNEDSQPPIVDMFAHRVRKRAQAMGMNAGGLSEKLGVPRSSASNYWTGKRAWPLELIPQIADALGTNVNDLFTTGAVSSYGDESVDLVEIDEIDMRYGMGASDVSGHVEPAKRVFSREWLQNFTDARPGQLYWAIGQGDSMEPTISSGDLILIDRSQDTMFDRDLIWACTVGDFGMIKRLRPSREGVTILSDNRR